MCLRTVVIIIRGPHTYSAEGARRRPAGGVGHDPVECSTLRGVTSVTLVYTLCTNRQTDWVDNQSHRSPSSPPPSPKIANIYVRLLGVFRASLSPTKYYYRFDRPNAEIIGYAKFWRYRFPNRVYIVCTRQ